MLPRDDRRPYNPDYDPEAPKVKITTSKPLTTKPLDHPLASIDHDDPDEPVSLYENDALDAAFSGDQGQSNNSNPNSITDHGDLLRQAVQAAANEIQGNPAPVTQPYNPASDGLLGEDVEPDVQLKQRKTIQQKAKEKKEKLEAKIEKEKLAKARHDEGQNIPDAEENLEIVVHYAQMSSKEDYIKAVKGDFIFCKGQLQEYSKEKTGLYHAPTYLELASIATNEKWLEQRIEFMQRGQKSNELNKAEVIARQLNMARKAQEKAMDAIESINPEYLEIKDAIALAKWGSVVEQLLLGISQNPMARINLNVDMQGMSDADLDILISTNNKAVKPVAEDLIRDFMQEIDVQARPQPDGETNPEGGMKSAGSQSEPNPYGDFNLDEE